MDFTGFEVNLSGSEVEHLHTPHACVYTMGGATTLSNNKPQVAKINVICMID
jgi:hypothetical protein